MGLPAVPTHVESWPPKVRHGPSDRIWYGLFGERRDTASTEGRLAEIDPRLADDDKAPADVVT